MVTIFSDNTALLWPLFSYYLIYCMNLIFLEVFVLLLNELWNAYKMYFF